MTPGGQFRSQRLSQGIFQRRSPDAPRGLSRRLRPLALAGTLGLLAVTLSGCSWQTVFALGWPEVEMGYRSGTRIPERAHIHLTERGGKGFDMEVESLGFVASHEGLKRNL